MTIKNYYNLLHIDPKSDLESIKAAFRKEIALYHPDKNKSPEAIEKFDELIEAFDILSHTEKRKAYDKMLKTSSRNKPLVIERKQEEQYQKWQKEAKTKSKKYKTSTLEELLLLDLFIGSDLLGDILDGANNILDDIFDLF